MQMGRGKLHPPRHYKANWNEMWYWNGKYDSGGSDGSHDCHDYSANSRASQKNENYVTDGNYGNYEIYALQMHLLIRGFPG